MSKKGRTTNVPNIQLILDSNGDFRNIPEGGIYITDPDNYIMQTLSMYRAQKLVIRIFNYTGNKQLTGPIQLGLIADQSLGFIDTNYTPGERIPNVGIYIKKIFSKKQNSELIIEVKIK